MKPLVSILIPAYNSEKWIADSIRSAVAQTWQPKEIIVVDDGSKDQTLSIAKQFESDSVRVFSQKNQGAAAARNNAFSMSHGDYIQWLDADDLLAPDKIARQWKNWVPGTLHEPFFLPLSPTSCIGHTGRDLSPARCGATFLGLISLSASWNRKYSCRPPCGSSAGS